MEVNLLNGNKEPRLPPKIAGFKNEVDRGAEKQDLETNKTRPVEKTARPA